MGILLGTGENRPLFPYDLWYGIEWDINGSYPQCMRIGSLALHQILPIQSQMKRCLLDEYGNVNLYLNPDNSASAINGITPSLNGSDGQVMVEIPEFYIRFEFNNNIFRCMLSIVDLPGFNKIEKSYVSAYEATVNRANVNAPKLVSVANATTQFRGGGNTSQEIAKDSTVGSSLGRPATNLTAQQIKDYTLNTGLSTDDPVKWRPYTYEMHRKLYWLYTVEYANLNSQIAFNPQLDNQLLRQGGLGAGVTALNKAAITNMTAGTIAVIPCGKTNSLGNKTGVVNHNMPNEYNNYVATNPPAVPIITTSVPSYRGVENPF
jgi:hypothetical protein